MRESLPEVVGVRLPDEVDCRLCAEPIRILITVRVLETRDESGELSPRRDIELRVDVVDVSLHCVDSDEETATYLTVCRTPGNETSHFLFSRGETVPPT